MSTTSLHAAVRRSNRNLLLVGIVGVIIVLAVLGLNARYFVNFFSGPTPITRDALLQISDPATPSRYWVNVSGDDVSDTGIQYVEEKNGNEEVKFSYYVLYLDDKLLLVKTPGVDERTEYTGAIMPISAEDQREVIDDLIREVPEAQNMFLPYMLDTSSFRSDGYIGLTVAAVVLILCAVWMIMALRRMGDPHNHPFFKRLASYGDVEAAAREIDQELLAPRFAVKNVFVTEHWLVSKVNGYHVMRLDDVVWLYKHVTQYRYYGVIPVGKAFAAHIRDRHGSEIQIRRRNEKQTHETLEAIMQGAPWALTGYDAQIEQAWKQNRSSVIDAVAQRRQQLFGAA